MSAHYNAVRQVEESLLNAWPALRSVHCNGWIFREARRFTKRANSASALASLGDFPATLAQAEQFYRAFDAPAIFRLTPLAGPEPDAHLADRGYGFIDETLVMTRALSHLGCRDPSIRTEEQLNARWERGHALAHPLDAAESDVHRAILGRIAPLKTGFAVVREGSCDIAFALGVVDQGMLGIFDVVTAPEYRRRSAGKRLVTALLHWGVSKGAHTAWLSVIRANTQAVPLYEQLGFRELYRYHYRVAPQHCERMASSRTSVALRA